MTESPYLTFFLIVAGRVTDVSLGTLRTVAIVQGRRATAFLLSLVEMAIWVMVIGQVVRSLDRPIYAVAYAIGFALGTWAGITLEGRLSPGRQVLQLFTRQPERLSSELRKRGFGVTQFDGSGRDGPIAMLFVEAPRRRMREVLTTIHKLEPGCFYVLNDVRDTRGGIASYQNPTGWRAVLKKK